MKLHQLALCILVLLGLEYYREDCRAVRNDLYMIWDVINGMKKDIEDLKKGEANEETD